MASSIVTIQKVHISLIFDRIYLLPRRITESCPNHWDKEFFRQPIGPRVLDDIRSYQGMLDEWVLWLNGAEILPIQPRSAEWGWMDRGGVRYMAEKRKRLNGRSRDIIQPHSAGLGWMGDISAPFSHNTHSSDMPWSYKWEKFYILSV